ncbi:MAG: alpha/beta hydrolase [Pseudomonadota bacterium]|nr:alpha/beta hydrolase [Pseudomonadota bacterium]MEC8072853.1 alpha/beta hydrolase [Pseudomonadota bacterium]MEC8349568.1 alpha/beta hydrolase [Pseudomonadota bacterium]MEC8695297.1 alpha/beta hydrolase [Pseudomonadota bacterium]GIS19601.1 MAG: alpha/beta hydrolase [Pseudomonadota bacterium]
MKIELNGEAVFYSTGSGKPADHAPTLVFVHGAGFDHSIWVMPARYFARHGWRVVAVDLPGHGRSGGALLTSIDQMADWVAQLIAAVSSDQQASVVGHSMGSLIAMSCAARYPDHVAKIALLGTSAPMPVSDVLLNAAMDNDQAAVDMTNIWSHSAKGRLGSSENPGLSNLHVGERLLQQAGRDVLYTDLAACNGFQAETLAPVQQPALVIIGDDDKMTPPRAGMAVADGLTDVRQRRLAGCGHSMLSEKPNEVLDELAAFLV